MRRLALLTLWACGAPVPEKVLSPADLDTDRARVTSRLEAPSRPGSPKEEAPPPLSSELLADEARLTRARGDEVCFAIATRTAAGLDRSLRHYRVMFDDMPVKLEGERVTVRDYPLGGGKESLVLEDGSIEEAARLGVPKAEEKVLRVFERAATGCQKMAGLPERMTLELVLEMDDRLGAWSERFAWRLAR